MAQGTKALFYFYSWNFPWPRHTEEETLYNMFETTVFHLMIINNYMTIIIFIIISIIIIY